MAKKQEPTVKAGVAVIVCKDHKVLVGKRKGSHGAGIWAFPGGHIEPTDKSLKKCGEREVLEEAGIVSNVYDPDHYRNDLFTTYDILSEDGTKVYVTCYLIADYLLGGKVVTDRDDTYIEGLEPEKCERWYWKTLDELALLVADEKANSWIPITKVAYYLKQIWGI